MPEHSAPHSSSPQTLFKLKRLLKMSGEATKMEEGGGGDIF